MYYVKNKKIYEVRTDSRLTPTIRHKFCKKVSFNSFYESNIKHRIGYYHVKFNLAKAIPRNELDASTNIPKFVCRFKHIQKKQSLTHLFGEKTDIKIVMIKKNDRTKKIFLKRHNIALDYLYQSRSYGLTLPFVEDVEESYKICDFICNNKKSCYVSYFCKKIPFKVNFHKVRPFAVLKFSENTVKFELFTKTDYSNLTFFDVKCITKSGHGTKI